MCNLYSITTNQAAISALFRVVNRYVGNLAPMPGVFPDYRAPIVRIGAEGRELATARWGMPSSSKALMDATKKRAEKLQAKGKPIPTPTPTKSKTPSGGSGGPSGDPVPAGEAQQIAKGLLPSYGMSGSGQFGCLVNLWNKESHWNTHAANPSGAYGIPQALPGSKMASAGPDWQNNATTQIKWGLGYIKDRYSTPCGAWAHSQSSGWY